MDSSLLIQNKQVMDFVNLCLSLNVVQLTIGTTMADKRRREKGGCLYDVIANNS